MNYSGKNIRVSNDVHQQIVDHLSEAVKIGKWVETAIKEKIEREVAEKTPNPMPFLREYEHLKTK